MIVRILNAIRRARSLRRFTTLATIGTGFRCGPRSYLHNESGDKSRVVIGDNVEINGSIQVNGAGRFRLGSRSTIRFGSTIESVLEVTIGEYAIISNNVTIADNNNHPTSPNARIAMLEQGFYGDPWHWRHAESAPVRIGRNVWIGHHATILKGVSVGEGAVIACYAVVTRDVPAFSVAAGNPARVVKQLSESSASVSTRDGG